MEVRFQKFTVQVYNKSVVDALQGSPWMIKQDSNLARHMLLLPHFQEVQFHYIFREANQSTDYLAKLGLFSSVDFFLVCRVPIGLRRLLRLDLSKLSLRLVA